MKRVHQLDECGCGIACVATLAGVSYTRVKSCWSKFHPNKKLTGISTKKLIWLLKQFGINTEGHDRLVVIGSKKKIKEMGQTCILKVNIKPNRDWHWVVWDTLKERVFDPDSSKKTRLSQFSVSSYLPVSR